MAFAVHLNVACLDRKYRVRKPDSNVLFYRNKFSSGAAFTPLAMVRNNDPRSFF